MEKRGPLTDLELCFNGVSDRKEWRGKARCTLSRLGTHAHTHTHKYTILVPILVALRV